MLNNAFNNVTRSGNASDAIISNSAVFWRDNDHMTIWIMTGALQAYQYLLLWYASHSKEKHNLVIKGTLKVDVRDYNSLSLIICLT